MSNPWFLRYQPQENARLRLFCFPFAGGGASIYRQWQSQLAPDVDIWAVQLPGRETRQFERPYNDLTQLLAALLPEITAVLPTPPTPYAFFGHSMGALIAYELCHQFQVQGTPLPTHLFASARRAPSIDKTTANLHHLPEDEFIAGLGDMQGTPPEILANKELMGLITPMLRADFTICDTYQAQPPTPLNLPITAFGGWQDPDIPRPQIAAWQHHTTKPFTLNMLPGGHFFLKEQQPLLLRLLTQALLPTPPQPDL